MKDLGQAAYILGIKIYRDRSKRLISLSQSAYIDKVLKRFSMEDSKRGEVKICRVPTYDNVADLLTKPLPQAKHDRHARFIGIRYIDEWA